jgi:hypothetical protein
MLMHLWADVIFPNKIPSATISVTAIDAIGHLMIKKMNQTKKHLQKLQA